jgi:hypothetical protein
MSQWGPFLNLFFFSISFSPKKEQCYGEEEESGEGVAKQP